VNSSFNPNAPVFSPFVDLYHVAPQAGQWRILLQWMQPVTGLELSANFSGAVQFNSVRVSSDLPQPGRSSRVRQAPNQNSNANAAANPLPLPLPVSRPSRSTWSPRTPANWQPT
jgi:hypothetical protein